MLRIITGGLRCGIRSIYQLARNLGLEAYLTHDIEGIAGKLCGRSSLLFMPYLLYEWEDVQGFFRDFGDFKIVVILRNPVERAFSLWKSNLMYGLEFKDDFEDALKIENRRFYRSKFREITGRKFWRYIYFRGGLYSVFLEKLKSFRESVKIFAFEEVFYGEGIKDIFDFLDLDMIVGREDIPHLEKSKVPAVPKMQIIFRRVGEGVFLKLPGLDWFSALAMKLNLALGRDLSRHWCVDFLKEAYKYEMERLNEVVWDVKLNW